MPRCEPCLKAAVSGKCMYCFRHEGCPLSLFDKLFGCFCGARRGESCPHVRGR